MQSRSSIPVYFPVLPNIFPVRGQKIPGYVATGIFPQPIDEAREFSGSNGRRNAEATRFPVIFPDHGNWRRRRLKANTFASSARQRPPQDCVRLVVGAVVA